MFLFGLIALVGMVYFLIATMSAETNGPPNWKWPFNMFK